MFTQREQKAPFWQRFRNLFGEFADETSIDAFVIIGKTKRTWETVVWVTVTSLLICGTFWNVTKTVSTFVSYKTETKLTVIKGTQIHYSNASVCLVRSTMRNVDTLKTFLQMGLPARPADVLQDLKDEYWRLKNMSDRFAKECNTSECWTGAYVDLLANLTSAPLRNGTLQFVWLLPRIINDVENNIYQDVGDYKPLSDMIMSFKELWTTLDNQTNMNDLRRLVGSLICHYSGLFAVVRSNHQQNHSQYHSLRVRNICSIDNVTWEGTTQGDNDTEYICTRIYTRHFLNFTDNQKEAFLVSTLQPNLTFSDSPFDAIKMIFDADLYPTVGNPNILAASKSSSQVATIEIVVRFEGYKGSGKCTNLIRPFCTGMLTDSQFRTNCNCSTTTWKWMSPNTGVRMCTLHDYFDIQENITTARPHCLNAIHSHFYDLEAQQSKCQPQCDYEIFRFTLQDSKDPFAKPIGTTILELKPNSFVILKVEELLSMDLFDFLSALGGSLSLWINASLIGILHAIGFSVRNGLAFLRDLLGPAKRKSPSVTALIQSSLQVEIVTGDLRGISVTDL